MDKSVWDRSWNTINYTSTCICKNLVCLAYGTPNSAFLQYTRPGLQLGWGGECYKMGYKTWNLVKDCKKILQKTCHHEKRSTHPNVNLIFKPPNLPCYVEHSTVQFNYL